MEYLHQELSFATLIDTQSIQHSKGDEQKSNRGSSSPLGAPSSSLEHLDAGGLPDFIRPLPESLTSIDRDYLRARGALQIPPPDLCDEIIGHYLCYVHPYLPVLYTSTLRQIMHGPHSPRKAGIGLFLFQAVMFSAVHLLDAQAIRRLGFDSPRDARRAFYERVRVCTSHVNSKSQINELGSFSTTLTSSPIADVSYSLWCSCHSGRYPLVIRKGVGTGSGFRCLWH